ncbi:MAG: hypothetical protein ACJAVV_003318 [Alphaproteobacteria bacterium]|jgi:hypothetical protein
MSNTEISEIWIEKKSISNTRLVTQSIDTNSLVEGDVLLEVNDFGFSANNITYALLGDKMGYWGFFPAEEGYGKVPIWGFATVVASQHADIAIGEKVFGYLPMASHLLITADKATKRGFVDVAQRRKTIAPLYDYYVRCASDPGYDVDKEGWQLNYWPLFTTSFVLDDYVGENMGPCTKTVIVTSASSKTAYGAAFLLKQHMQQRSADYQVIGLTSARNIAFLQNSECYDQVLTYDEISQLDMSGENWLLDFAGNKNLLLDIQKQAGDNPAKLVFIGATDVESQTDKPQGKVDGQLFFAPSQVKKRTNEWGPQGYSLRYGQAWLRFSKKVESLVEISLVEGAEKIQQLYVDGLAGQFDSKKIIVAKF